MTEEIVVIVRLNDKCGPMDRGEFYEDPLYDAFEGTGLGEVVGAGTQLGENFDVEYSEIEVCITGEEKKAQDLIINTLNEKGVPKGSKIIKEDGSELVFGVNDLMGFHFDVKNLPDELFEKYDINDCVKDIMEALDGKGIMTGNKNWEEEIVLYFNGPSFDEMKSNIPRKIFEHPLCKNCKVTYINES